MYVYVNLITHSVDVLCASNMVMIRKKEAKGKRQGCGPKWYAFVD